ncbi:MAG: Rieske (2Fe-2S) protein [Bacteroidales bacterium]|nr:Rieske (2Fe-2S) protein [Bacteroidales bacterium]
MKNVEQKNMNAGFEKTTRRNFIRILWIALVSVSLLEVASVVIAFLTSGGRKSGGHNNKALRVLGSLDDFPKGSVTPFRSDRLYLVRMDDGGLLALSLKCTHLGCAVSWNEDTSEFDCPCHASSFMLNGEVARPPAPRPLDYFPLIIESGLVKADLKNPVRRSTFNKSQLTYA